MSFSMPSCSKMMSPQVDFSGKPAISHLPLLSVQFHSSHVCKTRVHLHVHSGGAKVGVGVGNAQLGHVDSADKGSRLPLVDSQAAEQPKSPQTILQEVISVEMVRGPASRKSQMEHT